MLEKLIPSEVPSRTELIEHQFKEMTRLSFKVSHENKMLRVLGEGSLGVPESVEVKERREVGKKTPGSL